MMNDTVRLVVNGEADGRRRKLDARCLLNLVWRFASTDIQERKSYAEKGCGDAGKRAVDQIASPRGGRLGITTAA